MCDGPLRVSYMNKQIFIGLNTAIFIRQEFMCLIDTTSICFLKLLKSLKIPKLGRNMFLIQHIDSIF
jgi:hypothetical protein